MTLDGLIALASAFLERLDVEETHFTSAVPDEPCTLERARHHRHAAAPHAKHLRKELVGQHYIVRTGQVAYAQQPAAHASFDRVARVTPSRLLSLSEKHLLMPDKNSLQGFKFSGERS